MGLDLKRTYLLLGSNLGKREQYLADALSLIEVKVGSIFAKSAVYETAAWGKTDQPGFLNLAIGVKTALSPVDLLNQTLKIEQILGRVRHEKWGARLIDIDIVLYEDEIVNIGEELQIPHVEMHNRKFVMEPLSEIAPNVIHPILKKSVSEILATLTDTLPVSKI